MVLLDELGAVRSALYGTCFAQAPSRTTKRPSSAAAGPRSVERLSALLTQAPLTFRDTLGPYCLAVWASGRAM